MEGKEACPVERALSIIGSKWTALIIRDLLTGSKRFSVLRESLGNVSPRTLSQRLKTLEKHGIITRKAYAEIPPRVEYTLTDKGHSLEQVITTLRTWGDNWT